jgi:hypothetical protein
MQDRQVAIEEFGNLFGDIPERILNAFTRAEAGQDDKVTYGFALQFFGL